MGNRGGKSFFRPLILDIISLKKELENFFGYEIFVLIWNIFSL